MMRKIKTTIQIPFILSKSFDFLSFPYISSPLRVLLIRFIFSVSLVSVLNNNIKKRWSSLLGPQIPYLGFCACEEQGDTGVWQLVDPPILPLTHGPNPTFNWRESLLQEWHLPDLNPIILYSHRPETMTQWIHTPTPFFSFVQLKLSVWRWGAESQLVRGSDCILHWLVQRAANVHFQLGSYSHKCGDSG